MMNTRSKSRQKRVAEEEMEMTVKHFQDKIDQLANELFDSGFEMFMVLVKERASWSHQYGSEKGLKFLTEVPSLQSGFIEFCSDQSDKEIGTCTSNTMIETTDSQIRPKSLDKTLNVETAKEDGPDLSSDAMDQAALELEVSEEDAVDIMLDDHSNHETMPNKDDSSHDALSDSDSNGESSMKPDDQNHCETLIDFLSAGIENQDKSKEKMKDRVADNNEGIEKCTKETELINKIVKFYQDTSSVAVVKGPAGYVCDLCNLRVDKKNMTKHLIKHKNALEEAVLSCKTCNLKLPKSYMVKHNCIRRLPKHVEVCRRDLRYEIALIETKYRWLDFETPVGCELCDEVLKNISQCREHLICRHLSEFHCKFCGNTSQNVHEIISHLKEHTIGKVGLDNLKSCATGDWRCTQCNKTFGRKSTLSRHIEQIHTQVTSKLYTCSLCHRKYRSEAMFKKHVLFHKEKYSCKIDHCEAVFSSDRKLRKHRAHVHKDVSKIVMFLCNLCGKGFYDQGGLNNHLEWKHGTGEPEACEICGKVFKSKVALGNHKISHRRSLKYQCELCGISYKQRSGLFQHKKTYHSDSAVHPFIKVYRCEVCTKRFRYHRSFMHHLVSQDHMTENQTVNKDAILECPFCNEKFYIKDKLSRHIAHSHKERKWLECEYCGKEFSHAGSLTLHRLLHKKKTTNQTVNKDAIFECSLCDKKFYVKDKLSRHIARSHNEKKRRECEYCGKKFCHRGSLSRHRKIHTVGKKTTKQHEADNQPVFLKVSENGDWDQIHKVDQEPGVIMDVHFVELENIVSETCETQISTDDRIIEVQGKTEEMLVEAPDQIEVQGQTQKIEVKQQDQLEVQGQTEEILVKLQDKLVEVPDKIEETLAKLEDQIRVQGQNEEVVEKRKYQCELCGISYKQRSGLFQHKKTYHGNSTKHCFLKTYRCKVCKKSFRYQRSFFHHLISQGHMTPNQTVSKDAFLECEISHNQRKPHECEQCGKKFREKNGLTRHQKIHTKQRLFCHLCKGYFGTQIKLKMHIKENHTVCNKTPNQTVNEDAIFECSLCDKKFHVKDKLSRHIARSHNEKKWRECEYCGKKFCHRGSLSRHRKIHTVGKKTTKQHEADNQPVYLKVSENGDWDQIHKVDQEPGVIMDLHFVELENIESETCEAQISTEDHIKGVQGKFEERLMKPQILREVKAQTEEILVKPQDQLEVQGQTEKILVKPQDQLQVQGQTQEVCVKLQDESENQQVTINTTSGSELFKVLTGARFISYGDKTIQILGPNCTSQLSEDTVIQIITEQSLSNE